MVTSVVPRVLVVGVVTIACVAHSGCKPFIDAMNAAAEADRTVTVVVEGAVFGPTDATGQTWDRQQALPEGYAQQFLEVVAQRYPGGIVAAAMGAPELAGAVTEDLIARFNDHFAPPDPLGTVSIVQQGRTLAEYELPKRGNTYTPTWDVQVPQVRIHKARVVLAFKDSDFTANRTMAKVIIVERDLLAAEESGGLYAIDTTERSGGAVLRVLVSVYP